MISHYNMKFTICATFVFLIGSSNGSVHQSGIDLITRLRIPYYAHGTFSTVRFETNSPWLSYDTYEAPCIFYITEEIVTQFRVQIFKFITDSFRKAAVLAEGHFVYSPYTAWLSLAALAEGTEGKTRQELFKALSLPEDKCLRNIYYKLAISRELPSTDVILARKRVLIADSTLYVNKNWQTFAQWHAQLNTISVPFKTNSSEIENLKGVFKVKLPNINLNGNSFLLESLDYHGLWSSAFSDAVIETGPFLNNAGEQIGTMDYMKTTRRVNIAYAESANLKVIEIPVGRDGQYKMLFGVTQNKDYTKTLGAFQDNLVFEVLDNMRPSSKPIEIVIPRLTMTYEIEMRPVLEEMGVKSLWTDPLATRNISNPAALPSSFTQRVTVTLDNNAVHPPVEEYFIPPLQTHSVPNGNSDDENLQDFIANRPFIFGLYDVETYTLLFAAVFSKPNVSN